MRVKTSSRLIVGLDASRRVGRRAAPQRAGRLEGGVRAPDDVLVHAPVGAADRLGEPARAERPWGTTARRRSPSR
jgi:hypothetical protein